MPSPTAAGSTGVPLSRRWSGARRRSNLLQLREKELDQASFLAEAKELKALAARYRVPFVVNDSVEIAVQIGADGVHVGQSDTGDATLRSLLGPEKSSASRPTQWKRRCAPRKAAPTTSEWARCSALPPKRMLRTSRCSSCWKSAAPFRFQSSPSGGISAANIGKLAGSGIDGVSVISAIFAAPDPAAAARELRALSEKLFGGKAG